MSRTRFLNVDLELVSTKEVDPLLAHWSDATFTLRDSVDASRRTIWLELGGAPQDADAAVRDFADLVETLPADLRNLWNDCEDRCLNVGVEGGASPDASAFRISTGSIVALAAMSARLEFTVYGSRVPPKRRRRESA